MLFWERFSQLCAEKSLKPQSGEIIDMTGVSPPPSITGWSKGSLPKIDVVCRIADYFAVSTDYLLGVSEVRNSNDLDERESVLLDAFRSCNEEGKARITQFCLNERDFAEKKKENRRWRSICRIKKLLICQNGEN